MCMSAKRLREGNQERYNSGRKLLPTRQTEAHEQPGEKAKALRRRRKEVFKDDTLYWRNGEAHKLQGVWKSFIRKEVYTDLCLFLCFLKNLILVKLGLSQMCTVNFRKEHSKGVEEVDRLYDR